MQMSVGVLDHYNVSTRKLKETVWVYAGVLGFVNVRARNSISLELGCTAQVMPYCILTTFPKRTCVNVRIPASSIISRLLVAACVSIRCNDRAHQSSFPWLPLHP